MRERLHKEIESLAGAIALGEATDADRRAYREHIASCADCLSELGGEHELARTAAAVGAARDTEVWEPQLGNLFERRSRRPSQVVRFAAAFAVTFAGAATALHFFTVRSAAAPDVQQPVMTAVAGTTVKPSNAHAPAQQNQRRLGVYHNVVLIARAPVALPYPSRPVDPQIGAKAPEIAAVTVYPQTAPAPKHSSKSSAPNVPLWRTVSRMTTTALTETAPQRVSSAESLAIGTFHASTYEAAPIGGETAISPQPPMIAYAEGAEGTTAFEVLVDERGLPTKCIITKPAGYRFLDDAVCKAAMKARFSPKTIEGRAVPGVYRDAFTFRVSTAASDGLPKPIH
ncbi:MAG TPA: TonB family protein [Candidatus Rubrimentiphilum sp.]|nr:TonB family protein [Candidatus Rubrimentiphilum sp.]